MNNIFAIVTIIMTAIAFVMIMESNHYRKLYKKELEKNSYTPIPIEPQKRIKTKQVWKFLLTEGLTQQYLDHKIKELQDEDWTYHGGTQKIFEFYKFIEVNDDETKDV